MNQCLVTVNQTASDSTTEDMVKAAVSALFAVVCYVPTAVTGIME